MSCHSSQTKIVKKVKLHNVLCFRLFPDRLLREPVCSDRDSEVDSCVRQLVAYSDQAVQAVAAQHR